MGNIFEDSTKEILTREDFLLFWQKLEETERSIFKKGGISDGSPHQRAAFLNKLGEYLQKLPQVKIEIAFQPDQKFISKLADWFRKEINQRVILDVIYNPGIAGGLTLEYKGKHANFSLSKKIDELFKNYERF